MEMVIIRKVSGEDNSVIVFTENLVITQEPIRKIEKRVIY